MKKRKGLIYSIFGILIIGVAAFFIFRGGAAVSYDFVIANRGSVTQEVSVTGKVVAVNNVDLAFESGGKVAHTYVDIGDTVKAGDLLASLDVSSIEAQLAQAEASVKAEKASLAELEKGMRTEELRVYEVKVENAEVAIREAKKSLIETIQDSYTKSDDAIRNRVDQLYINPRTRSPKLVFFINDAQLIISLERGRATIGDLLNLWKSSLESLSTESDLDAYIVDAKQNLSTIRQFLGDMASAVNSLTPTASLSQATITSWKTDVITGRTNVNTASTSINTADGIWKNAEAARDLANEELTYKRSGATSEQIAVQEARVEQMESQVSLYRAQIRKASIYSPIAGMVIKQDAKEGEIVTQSVSAISVISAGNLEVESFIPEADVAKIKKGDIARIALDAYGDDNVFNAVIAKIDPTETTKEGVPTYKTTLQFTDSDSRPRSGMTANITILTGERNDVLIVPGRAVFLENGQSYIIVVNDEKLQTTEKVQVKTGLRGSDGNIEVINGIVEGDKVVTFMRTTTQ
ncbi:MAG: efflux RND transporter periplasmic adaptor subunit [bacterium]